jgi:hypothetical protein
MVSKIYTAPHITLAPPHLSVQKNPYTDPSSTTTKRVSRYRGAMSPTSPLSHGLDTATRGSRLSTETPPLVTKSASPPHHWYDFIKRVL